MKRKMESESTQMFQVVYTQDHFEVELYGSTFGPRLTPCEWARMCPTNDECLRVQCNECPAKECGTPLTVREVADWWRQQNIAEFKKSR